MRRLVLVISVSVLAATMSSADARHRHRHHRLYVPSNSVSINKGIALLEQMSRPRQPGNGALADLVPRSWQLQPPDADWKGKRFVSPDGSAWFAAYSAPLAREAIASHMQTVAFGDGETVTYLRGERNWIAVSGIKEGRIFYRKAIIACAGNIWHHIAFEYPAALKRQMEAFVTGAADLVHQTENEGCDDAMPSASQDSQPVAGNWVCSRRRRTAPRPQ